MSKPTYKVWNNDKSSCFITNDKQLAYEVRKGATSNVYDADGNYVQEAAEFCEKYSEQEDCTIEEVYQ